MFSCRFAGNPTGFTGINRNPAVCRHCIFQCDIRLFFFYIMKEYRIYSIAFFAQEVFYDFDTCIPKQLYTFTGNLGIRITRADDNLSQMILNNCIGTRWCLSIMAAWFQSDVNSCTCRRFCAVCQSISLGMQSADMHMIAFADNASVLHNYGTDYRIGIRFANGFLCQSNGTTHDFFFCHQWSPFCNK